MTVTTEELLVTQRGQSSTMAAPLPVPCVLEHCLPPVSLAAGWCIGLHRSWWRIMSVLPEGAVLGGGWLVATGPPPPRAPTQTKVCYEIPVLLLSRPSPCTKQTRRQQTFAVLWC